MRFSEMLTSVFPRRYDAIEFHVIASLKRMAHFRSFCRANLFPRLKQEREQKHAPTWGELALPGCGSLARSVENAAMTASALSMIGTEKKSQAFGRKVRIFVPI